LLTHVDSGTKSRLSKATSQSTFVEDEQKSKTYVEGFAVKHLARKKRFRKFHDGQQLISGKFLT